jgi:hypothetical protein
MTDYVKSTNFASKDSLAIGNPLKIVKGTEIDAEFNNIATAVATKADLNSPALIGVPEAPTATLGTNTAQLSTTAFVQAAIAAAKQALYPVGSIYVNAVVNTNPATLLGFGTWVAFGAGRVMVGLNGSDTLFDTLEETGGSKDAAVVSHTHTATVTDPGHTHTPPSGSFVVNSSGGGQTAGGGGFIINGGNAAATASRTTGITVANSTEGSSGTNANLQPYITVAMWKRTA